MCLSSLESHSFWQLQFRSGLESTTWPHSEDLHFPSCHFPSHLSVQSTKRMLRKLSQTNIHKSDKYVAKAKKTLSIAPFGSQLVLQTVTGRHFLLLLSPFSAASHHLRLQTRSKTTRGEKKIGVLTRPQLT